MHLLSAYACEAGLGIGQRAVDGKSNEIKAIPELLDVLAIKGAIVSIDAMAPRAHWGIENNLHWQLEMTFDEDRCRTRKDFSPLNLAIVRHMAFNILKRDHSRLSLKRKRLKASVNPAFRAELLAR